MVRKTALLFSWLFHPIFLPSYIVFILISPLNPVWNNMAFEFKATILVFTFAITALFPGICTWWFQRKGMVKSMLLSEKNERLLPFLITAISNGVFTYKVYQAGLPNYLIYPFLGITISILLLIGINFFSKISAHMVGMGGLTAYCLLSPMYYAILSPILLPIAFLLSGIIGTSRLILEEHTPIQISAGYLLGFVCLFITLTYQWF